MHISTPWGGNKNSHEGGIPLTQPKRGRHMKEKDYVFEMRKKDDDPRLIIKGDELCVDDATALTVLSDYVRKAQSIANILACDMCVCMFTDGGCDGLDIALILSPEEEQ